MSLDKHKRLLTALHARCDASARFWNTGASNGALRVLVAGGGPVGLRAAIEMALLGHKVTVYEGRDECRRLNVLKMWEETIADLERLGLSFLDPDFCNGRDLRASTARLQLALLKVLSR